jgi:hypothetical protein
MEAASASETSVNFYQTTRRSTPQDSHLHIHRHENLKSYKLGSIWKDVTVNHKGIFFWKLKEARWQQAHLKHPEHAALELPPDKTPVDVELQLCVCAAIQSQDHVG